MTDPSALDLEEIRACHPRELAGSFCDNCRSLYPCDVIDLCDEIDRLRAENERYRAALEKIASLDNCIYQINASRVACTARRALDEKENGE